MKFKQIFSLILSAAITVSSLNTVFSAEYDKQPTTITKETALSDSALDLVPEKAELTETVQNADLASSTVIDSGSCGNNATYTIYDDGEMVISGTGELVMSTSFQNKWQKTYVSYIKNITVESGITSTRSDVFSNLTSLESITFPDTFTSLGQFAFSGCTALKNVSLPNSLITIGDTAFYECSSLESITIPDSVTTIEFEAFEGCTSLKSIIIPDSVTSMGTSVFGGCTSLTDVTLSNSITNIAGGLFGLCSSLKTVTIPDSVISIDRYAFQRCTSLESIVIPDSVVSIGDYAFVDCVSLSSITIPYTVINIGESVFGSMFYSSGLTTVYCYKNSTADDSSLYPDGTTIVYLDESPDNVTATGVCGDNAVFTVYTDGTMIISGTGDMYDYEYEYSLGSTSLWSGYKDLITSVTIEDGITSIGDYAFYDCTSLASIEIADSVTSIGNYAFAYSGAFTNITIPEAVTSIGNYAFFCCSALESIVIPDSVTSLGAVVFANCTALKSAVISNSVTSIKESTFAYCDSLTSITVPDTVKTIERGAFNSCKKLASVDLGRGITSIAEEVFSYCTSLKSITIPDTVKTLGSTSVNTYFSDGVFYCCSSLTNIVLGNSLISIGMGTFAECSSLTNITIPDSVTTIGGYAFMGCSSLTNITIPDSVTTIGEYSFTGCTTLTSVDLSNSLEKLESGLFNYCISLESVNFGSSNTYISGSVFSNCSSLKNIVIPETVTTIGNGAFNGCSDLTATILNKSVYIADSSTIEAAFKNCKNLTIYCYRYSTADDTSLYPSGTTIIYLDGTATTETTTETTTATESTTETTTEGEAVAAPAFKVVGVFGGRSVTFTSETDGAVIYYSSSTSNITTDDICVQNGETVTYEDYYGTIYARAYYNGVWSDVNKFVLKIPVVNTPTVTASGSNVTIKSTTPSSFICYTTDGSEPIVETDGTLTNGTWLRVNGARTNSGTVTAEPGDTVRAVAVRSCFTTSASAAAYVNVSPAAFTVVGTFGGRNVTFKSDTSGAKIYYSSTTSSLTTSDKCVSNGETVLFENFYGTIYARAYYNGKWSNVSRLILKIPTINTPTVSYSGGKATIRTTTPSCYIYYTTDGSTPSVTNGKKLCSNSYGQVSVSSGTTIKAIAVRSCFTNSEVVSCTVS